MVEVLEMKMMGLVRVRLGVVRCGAMGSGVVHFCGGKPMKFLDGWKTHIAALLAAFSAVNKILHLVPPEVEDLILKVAIALGLYGLRDAIAKVK